jgi:hypothetical protein
MVLPIAVIVVTVVLGGNVLAQHAACLRGWQFENISQDTSGPLITGTPATITWYQARFGGRDDVWARNDAGGLIHYFRKKGQAWRGENLSAMARGPSIDTDPVALLSQQEFGSKIFNRHDIFAVNQYSKHLIHYWWSEIPPSGWHAEDLTTSTSGPEVWSKPIAANSYYRDNGELRVRHDVYSLDLDGFLLHYFWTRNQGWRTERVAPHAFAPRYDRNYQPGITDDDPTRRSSEYHHFFGRDVSGHLLHYFRDSNGWHPEDLTFVNGTQIGPGITNGTFLIDNEASPIIGQVDRIHYHVFSFQGSEMVRFFQLRPNTSFESENVTAAVGFVGTRAAISGTPVAAFSRQFLFDNGSLQSVLEHYDVYARDANGGLIHYGASAPYGSIPDANGGIPWAPGENITDSIGGGPIESDPLLSVRQIPRTVPGGYYETEHLIIGRNGESLSAYCRNLRDDWAWDPLESISWPPGENVGQDPVLAQSSTVGTSIYVVGLPGAGGISDAPLLHYWKP